MKLKVIRCFIIRIIILLLLFSTKSYSQNNTGSCQSGVNNQGKIVICNKENLRGIEGNLGGNYILGQDIDLAGTNWDPIGGWISYDNNTPFTGTFDGNGYKIKNMTINRPTEDYIGLFGYVERGTIINLGIEGGTINGNNYVGGMVGYIKEGEIRESYTASEVSGDDYVGGMVGFMNEGTIRESYTASEVSGDEYVGGMVGFMSGGEIRESYTASEVSGEDEYVGGMVGSVGEGFNYNNNRIIL